MIKSSLLAGATAAVLLAASQVSAATINFSSAGTGAAGVVGTGPLSYTTSAASSFAPLSALVSVTGNGLGVRHTSDTQPGRIDGALNTSETLTVTFSWAVKLLDFTLGRVDRNDDFEYSLDGVTFTTVAASFTNPFSVGADVTSFSIRASGANVLDSDNFTLAFANVAPVPLPAGGLLLVAALGGLAALRRKRAA